MSLEDQLRELLDKLDLTCSMKSSGSRSKRAKLLKKEIALVRTKLSQQQSQPPPAESGTGGFEEEGAPRGQEPGEEGKKRCLPASSQAQGHLWPRPQRHEACGAVQSCCRPSAGQLKIVLPSWVLESRPESMASVSRSIPRGGRGGRRA